MLLRPFCRQNPFMSIVSHTRPRTTSCREKRGAPTNTPKTNMGITKKRSPFANAHRQIYGGFFFFFSMRTSAAALKHKYINVAPRGLCFLLLTGVFKSRLLRIENVCVCVCVCVYIRSVEKIPRLCVCRQGNTDICSQAVTAGTAGQEVVVLSSPLSHTHTHIHTHTHTHCRLS